MKLNKLIKTLTHNSRFQIDENWPRNIFSSHRLAEESVERIILHFSWTFIHLTVRQNAMFEAVQLPASVADLNSGLSDVKRNTLALKERQKKIFLDLKESL